jgi:hypothetical protein
MRIIADQKDYYDCIMGCGQDRTVVYVRKPEEQHLDRKEWPFPNCHGDQGDAYIIGFCGKIYPLIELYPPLIEHDPKPTLSIKCFSLAEVDAFMEQHLRPRELRAYHEKGRYQRRLHFPWGSGTRRHYEDFFRECAKQQTQYEQMFMEKRCPIFVAYKHGRGYTGVIEWNSMLNKYGFFRVFDTYTAFQEIAMFVGNLAIPQKPMPVIPDKLKAESKGFNEWSFRKPPASDR